MKSYASFDAFLDDQGARDRAIVGALRKFVRRAAPSLTESVKWGNGCWLGEGGPVAYAHCQEDCVQFGFFHGASLDDPKRLLEGKGKFVRFVRLTDASDVDARVLAPLLRQAAASAAAQWAAVKRRPRRRA